MSITATEFKGTITLDPNGMDSAGASDVWVMMDVNGELTKYGVASAANVTTDTSGALTAGDVQGDLEAIWTKLDAKVDLAGDTMTGGLIAPSVQLSGGTGTQGTLSWNADEETLDLVNNDVVLQLGQEIHVNVKNQTGVTIADGTPVMSVGTVGASGRILIGEMIGSVPANAKYLVGLTTEEITNGADGKVTSFGKIRGIDTTGTPYGETWADGDVLWIDPVTTGGLTNVEPTDIDDMAQSVAFVIHAHASTGTLMARVDGLDEHAFSPHILANEDQVLSSARTISNGSNNYSLTINLTDGSSRAVGAYTPALGLISLAGDDGTNGAAVVIDPNGHNTIYSGTGDHKLDSDPGSAGERFTSNGANSAPTWERPSIVVSGTAPASPANGQGWFDTGTHGTYFYNSTESLWIDTCRESTFWGKPGASGTSSGFFSLSANLNLGTYGLEVEEDMILDSVAFSSDGTTSGSWTFRVKKNGTQIYGLAAPTSGSYDRVYSGDLIGSGHTFAAGDRLSCEYGSGAGSASFTDARLIVYWRRTV